ncbi:hypothetical protein ICW40_11520 [Actinotalea ferrariae]|uniref:hypothetical protein n=1 Tax=Actinotalea ferrariae TaxID=1386098 RepID=UPI001C8CCD27|nr:hypothetical protein [Actinotalea ferrariae]MBX9245433.1 hypothetical protein [Actinotalea ferrariae]
MHRRPGRALAAAGVVMLGLLAPTTTAAAAPSHGPEASRGGVSSAAGEFVASVDFTSLRTRDIGGAACEFTVDGSLTFSGALEGVAVGTTTALIFAPCAEALASPPGTYVDVFAFDGRFTGEVGDQPASGPLRYAGVTRVGGGIDALITLRGRDAQAVLRADAQVAVGGTYEGLSRARG